VDGAGAGAGAAAVMLGVFSVLIVIGSAQVEWQSWVAPGAPG
jgi:hypothetical protein